MAKATCMLIAAFLAGASTGYPRAVVDDYAVSPELAKKAAVYYFVECHGEFLLEEGFEYFLISEAEVFYSLRGERKWYSFYMAVGTKRLPTRGELVALARAEKSEPEGGHIFHVPISASRLYAPTVYFGSGMPPELRWRPDAEDRIRKATGGRTAAVTNVFYYGYAIKDAYFEFEVDGRKYYTSGAEGRVLSSADISEEPPGDPNIYPCRWERIDNVIPRIVIGGEKIYIRDIMNNIYW
jgi:hypothetical protein